MHTHRQQILSIWILGLYCIGTDVLAIRDISGAKREGAPAIWASAKWHPSPAAALGALQQRSKRSGIKSAKPVSVTAEYAGDDECV
jgi:hypothetical protein